MYETVTVNEAISRGRKMITYPVMIIIFGITGICFYLSSQKYIPEWGSLVGLFGGIVVAWIYWSVMITKWRLWAFDNVRNVHELQRKAVEAQLIWNDGSFWEKTEIRGQGDKDKWAALQDKLSAKDVYTEDITVPQETLIYYSRGAVYIQIGFMAIIAAVGVYLIATHEYLWGTGLCLVGIYFIYSEYKKAADKRPQIILNEKGIETISAGFNKWNAISDDGVVIIRSGKSTTAYLQYNYGEGSEKLSIEELATNKQALENLLHTYRVRSEKRNKN